MLLEASAGTGKTWTIGALVTRYVVEGVARLEQMLVVTFGRAASQELRERVRAQLVEAERVLGDDPAERAAAVGDRPSDLVTMLLAYDDEQRRVAHRRVVDALVGFDAATIATTHQFCSMVLDSLGVAGDSDSRARLVEDLDDLVKETVDDLYLRAFALDEHDPVFDYATALTIARRVVDDPQAWLEPAAEDRSTVPGRRVAFARAVRTEMDRRKRRLGILSYDDLLSQLRDALRGEGSPAADRMRRRWQIVLVDEFQDTDPVQWEVLDLAFSGHATMVLIGDPKQAIYAFRGGDVTTYLKAAETATTQQTLAVNWRSDQPLLSSLQELLRGAALGDEQHRGPRRRGPSPREPAGRGRRPVPRPCRPAPGPREADRAARRRPDAAADRPGPRPRRTPPPRLRGHLRRAALAAARHRGDQLPARRPRRRPGGLAARRCARRDRRWRQRVRDTGRDRVADPPRGAGPAPPQHPRALGRVDLLLRPYRRPARRARRRPHRRRRRHTAVLARALRDPRARGGARVGDGRRAPRPRAGGARWRAPPHRPASHRRGAARGDPRRAPRPGLAADLAARAGRRGPRRSRARAHPSPRQRRGGGAAGDHPRQQGPGVPRRLSARRLRPTRLRARAAALPRRRGPTLPQRRRRGPRVGRPRAPGAGGGCR